MSRPMAFVRLAFFSFAITMVAFVLPMAAAGAPAPVWNIRQHALPSNFAPGATAEAGAALETAPLYLVGLTNLGGAPVSAGATITDTLPTGITPAAEAEPEISVPVEGSTKRYPCEPPAGQTISCIIPEPVLPGGLVRLLVPIDVSPAAAGSVVNRVEVAGGGAAAAQSFGTTEVSNIVPSFGFLPGQDGLAAQALTESGQSATSAGSHPFMLNLEANTDTIQLPGVIAPNAVVGAQTMKNLSFALPSGVVFNPRATPVRCKESQLVRGSAGIGPNSEGGCPVSSQVGVLYITGRIVGYEINSVPLYNMVPPPGVPAELAFEIANTQVHIQGGLDGDFHLTAGSKDILAKVPVFGIQSVLWGNPGDPRHNAQRVGFHCASGCAAENSTETPLLTMPSACSGPPEVRAAVGSWEDPNSMAAEASAPLTNVSGQPVGVEDCQALQFVPVASLQLTSQAAEAPSGLEFNLRLPQNEGLNSLATSTLKRVEVQLPAGVTVNPPAANGLGACSPAAVGLGNSAPASCPESAKVGSAEIVTPLLEAPLQGAVYLAEQGNNPFGTLLALYLVVEGEGIVVKLPGRVDADGRTGRLTAVFDDNPQLPFSELHVQFSGGPRATLSTPQRCGAYTGVTSATPWSSPLTVSISSQVLINQHCANGSFNPRFEAGTISPVAGTYSPFTLRIQREDGDQNLLRVTSTLPEGLLAKLAGVPLCPDALASSGDCPAGSQIGTTTAGVGSGSQPLYIPQPGKAPTGVYLAGPYEGAPYSLVVKVPAQAGPFNLGTVAIRVALQVDPFTAQVTAASDPLPQILQGIPVAYRDLRVEVSRSQFVLNPTSCDPMKVTSSLVAAGGAVADPSSRFQVAGCDRLAFKPKLAISLKGATRRAGHPALKAVLTYPNGASANIARAQVGLPHSEFLDQGNIHTVCKQAALRAGTGPKASIYGRAKAWSPLLDKPLEGPVYLGVGFGHKLPDLVADLNGQVRILVHGKVDTDKQEGLRNTFEAVPDAPVSRFVLEMKGGPKKGLLENSTNICKGQHLAEVRFTGHNAKVKTFSTPIANNCKRKRGNKHG